MCNDMTNNCQQHCSIETWQSSDWLQYSHETLSQIHRAEHCNFSLGRSDAWRLPREERSPPLILKLQCNSARFASSFPALYGGFSRLDAASKRANISFAETNMAVL